MNILKAIKSGKRFRPKGTTLWHENNPGNTLCKCQSELIADDWELEEDTVSLTKPVAVKIIDECMPYIKDEVEFKNKLLSELGF